jgi:malonyl-CoA/methylmalonyl-CoA synthetase
VLPRRSLATNLDALEEAWEWTGSDVLTHALPLFHVHGLVVGLLGPLRRGGELRHLGRFDPSALAHALEAGATMVFGVPTMYHRLAQRAAADARLAAALRRPRLLVSGSAPLPAPDFDRIGQLTGQRIVERYGLTETLMNTAVRAGGERRPGYVGTPLRGVEVRLVGEDGTDIEESDDETIGEVAVHGPNVFTGYLGRPDATDAAMRQGWFFTGDLAARAPNGYLRIVGRSSTDLIKTGGYRVGAGEVETALLGHPGVEEVAVVAAPDPDLGERIVAFVVTAKGDSPTAADELIDHVAGQLAPHKRPREVRFVDSLPRNAMGKVMKNRLVV